MVWGRHGAVQQWGSGADHQLYLINTNFQHKRSHWVTWRPGLRINRGFNWTTSQSAPVGEPQFKTADPSGIHRLTQTMNFVHARLSIKFPSGGRKQTRTKSFRHLHTAASAQEYRFNLAQKLSETIEVTQSSNQVEET